MCSANANRENDNENAFIAALLANHPGSSRIGTSLAKYLNHCDRDRGLFAVDSAIVSVSQNVGTWKSHSPPAVARARTDGQGRKKNGIKQNQLSFSVLP